MQRAKKRLDRSIAHMDPYDTAMQQWCTAAAAKLLRSAAMPESDWPEVDRLVNGFEYHFGDISEWPNDMVRVHPVDSTETVTCFLGSLAALRCLRDTKEVHVVITSVCAYLRCKEFVDNLKKAGLHSCLECLWNTSR